MSTVSTTSSAAPTTSRKAAPAAYLSLMKPHVTVMLLGVTLASMVLATGGLPPLRLILATLTGGALAAGSANALNCYWDRDIDRLMQRTRRRSVPAGRVAAANALRFGLALGVGSFLILGIFVNLLSALLALAAILFYVCVYTMWLKRATPRNIVIGGAAGAVPVLVGWAAVTNGLGLTPLVLFLIIFLWTPPHFWALALVLRQDYARAGVPMLPVARGEHETYRQIVRYTVILVATSLVPVVTHALGLLYLVCALALGAGLLAYAMRLAIARRPGQAYTLFWLSNHYLALLFAAMVVDRLLH
ncbi:MAG TPA: heme o synthase [Chloroflexota bacterium]|nr:heme o synthase [Chloroflexota bacterium]